MEALLEMMLARLRGKDLTEIYAGFDGNPAEQKSGARFGVLTQDETVFGRAFPSPEGEVHPFTAQFRLDVLTPMTDSPGAAQSWFETVLLPRLLDGDGTVEELRMDKPAVDLKLRKLVCTWHFRLRGWYLAAEGEESA